MEIIFNRDMMMDEGQIISNIKNSVGILSLKTLLEQDPWIDDADKELARIEEEKRKEQKDLYNTDVFLRGGVNHETTSE